MSRPAEAAATAERAESTATIEPAESAQREQMGDGGSVATTVRTFLVKWKFWMLLALILVLVVIVPFFARSAGTDTGILSPNNPAPEGAMAAAEILRQEGIEVRHTDTLEETLQALGSAPGASTLLLHDRLQLLAPEQLQQLTDTEVPTVLIEPSVPLLGALAANIESAGVVPEAEEETLAPSCSLEDAEAAGPIDRGGLTYRGPQMCYQLDQPGAPASAGYVQNEDGSVTVLGNGSILSNDRLAAAGNAALVLRTLGSEPLLVWYQPTLADIALAEQPPTLGELMPPWVNLILLWLTFVAVLAMLWKGRRVGPLVPEPLPVWAKASETAEGRARLYQDSRAVGRTADNLRAAALVRLAHHFRLNAGVNAEQVAHAAGQHCAAPQEHVEQVLLQYHPATEAELLRWVQQLQALEKEVTAR